MSTDLELRQESLQIRLPRMTLKTPASQSSDITTDGSVIIQSEEKEECRTPKSPENIIPKILSCPPAPKKPRRVATCKRKLCEFFEFVAAEEVESFFRQFDVNSDSGGIKKRCLV